MKILSVTTDDKDGHNLQLFLKESDAENYVLDWCKGHWHKSDGLLPTTAVEAIEALRNRDCPYFIWYETHELDDAPIISSAKAQLGHLLEQVHQMRGMFSDSDGAIQEAVEDAQQWNGAV